MNKKLILIAAALIAIVGALVFSFAGNPKQFSDIKADHWAFEAVKEMSVTGIISGYPDGTFKPQRKVSYGEFIKMAVMAAEAAGDSEKARKGEHWAVPYYETGLNNFYFSDWDIDKKLLDCHIPRKDMALIASGIMGNVKVSDYGNYSEILSSIHDIDEKHSHEFYIVKAYATGVLSGYPDGSFKPEGTLTRAEAASVVLRLKNMINDDGSDNDANIDDEVEDSGGDSRLSNENESIYRDDINDLVAVEKSPLDAPKGTVVFMMFDYSKNTEKRHAELLKVLNEYFPNEAKEMHKTLIKFASRSVSGNEQGIRKQYFGNYPVLMEHYPDTVGIYVYPIGYTNDYWKVKPGQVYEGFI